MKTLYIILLTTLSIVGYTQQLPIEACTSSFEGINPNHSKAKPLQSILEELTHLGIPGSSMAIYSSEGWWIGSAGYAKIEDKTLMQTCHLQYLQSVAKTYMAVGILKLYELGKIDLDAPITNYLPEKYSRFIKDAAKVTVRMALNHTSGIPEYNLIPAYVTKLLQRPDYFFTAEDYLTYIDKKSLDFEPGSKYSYRNTNYVVLSLICDAITGDHAKFLTETIIKPLSLINTYYRVDPGYLNYPNLVNSYWDRFSNGIVENASLLQRNNVRVLVGDDGIVATPIEAVKFLRGLLEGKLLSEATMKIMKSWAKDSKGNFTYGLGLDYASFGGHPAYGHSGGGIGAGCQLYYFPEKNVYMFIGINLGTVTESPLHTKAEKTVERIYSTLLD